MLRYFCTLFDINYLTRGLALYDSLVKHCPDFRLWILCMDEKVFEILQKMELKNVELITLEMFEDEKLRKTKKDRTLGEYCWTCTPSLPLYIIKKNPNLDNVAYLDSDLYFYSSPEPIYREMGKNSIMIIPHRIVPWKKEKEKDNGIYNVGMLIFRNDKEGLKCLQWWRERCLEWCYYRIENGKMGDQKYLDEFPKLFNGVCILENLGACVAPWNIGQYKIEERKGRVLIDGYPLIFYHFGGLGIFTKLPFLNPTVYGPYRGRELRHKIIYRPYFDKIYEMQNLVKRYEPKYKLGFAKRSFRDYFSFDVFYR